MFDPLENELKNRLKNYSEDPDDRLWDNILFQVKPTISEPSWISWMPSASVAVVGLLIIMAFYLPFNEEQKRNKEQYQTTELQPVTNQEIENKVIGQASHITVKPKARLLPGRQTENHQDTTTRREEPIRTRESVAEKRPIVQFKFTEELGNRNSAKSNSDERKSTNENSFQGNIVVTHTVKDERMVMGKITKAKSGNGNDTEQNSIKGNLVETKLGMNDSVNGNVKENSVEGNLSNPLLYVDQKASSHQTYPEVYSNEKKLNEASTSGIQRTDSVKKKDSVPRSDAKNRVAVENESANIKKELQKKPLRRTALYFTVMPTLGYQRIEANRNDYVIVSSVQKLSSFSAKRMGIRAEMGFEYSISDRFKLFSGILYYQRKQTINYTEKVLDSTIVDVTGSQLALEPQFSYMQKQFEYELKNLGVQLGMNYKVSQGRFLQSAGMGIEFHKGLNKVPKDQLKDFGKAPSTYVFYNLYYRIQYPAEGRFKATFQPTFNYSFFLNQNMNAPFYVKPYGLGLNIGATYNF